MERVSWVPQAKLVDEPEGPTIDGFFLDPPTHDAENCPRCEPVATPSGRVWVHRGESWD
jgi:hypothetical protein